VTRALRSLSNRIFLASAALAVLSILAAVWLINRSITEQTEREIARGLFDAAMSVDEYRRLTLTQLAQSAQLVADLPKFKAAVELDDPPTVAPLAADYRARLGADALVVLGRGGRLLAGEGRVDATAGWPATPPAGDPRADGHHVAFAPQPDGILQLVTVPIWIDPEAPDVLGTLVVGMALDSRFAAQIKGFTDSDVVFAWDGRVRAGTLPASSLREVEQWLAGPRGDRVAIGGDDYGVVVRPLRAADPGSGTTATAAGHAEPGTVVVLRSRTERLRPLRALHRALAAIALTAVLLSTLLSYLVARTVTRPVRAITATMRDMARSGDLTRGTALMSGPAWGDEDASVLASTFNAMTESLRRFQREAAQRERLSSLGRLSTVIAHEIRNPLMIIKTALRSLRRIEGLDTAAATAVSDIDEEVARLNALVDGVLDFARPIRFTLGPASLSALCRDAVSATAGEEAAEGCDLRLDPGADAVVTDAERLRQALVNVLANARQAVAARIARDDVRGGARAAGNGHSGRDGGRPISVRTEAADGDTVRILVTDHGVGLDPQSAARAFEPFFTTKTTGTGIGLAITRNIVEGLGGSVRLASAPDTGTEVLIELPRTASPSGGPNA
jgi:signal transduction histidine kinase